jgi:hypothetical protein
MEPSEEYLSTAALKQRGMRPRIGETPAKIETWHNNGRTGVRHLWRLDQAVEIRSRILAPVHLEKTPENIMLAIWSVNRAAKRRRDAAEASYEKDLHGFAGAHKGAKDRYYRLKDIGIAWLAHHGHLAAAYRHGQLVVWVGDGYSFHSTLIPRGAELAKAGDNVVRMEAKPAGSRELRLVDAQALLGSLASVVTNYDRIIPPWMRLKQERRDRSYVYDITADGWDEDGDDAGPE